MCRQRLVIAEHAATGELSEDVQMLNLDAITTPSDLRRSVCAALRERALLGDRLAEGALKVVAHLEDQANRLAWQLTPKPEESGHCYAGAWWCNEGGECQCDCTGCKS
jgi:hypothetical protein